MLELILMVSLSPALQSLQPVSAAPAPAAVQTAQFRPCVWPNKCKAEPAAVATYKPCVFPNRCGSKAVPVTLAAYKPCVFPNRCGSVSEATL